ncbi:DUF488 domain-containing protein [Formicincola oecophyllae]|nr:DUF488 family protein [Formicincola oecophyllae]
MLKRAYEAASPADGKRVLVDRLWPRGISKEKADLTGGWLKALAPSTALREWFHHDRALWPGFVERYRQELEGPEQREALRHVRAMALEGPVTLVYGARDTTHNEAVVLRDVLLGQPTALHA